MKIHTNCGSCGRKIERESTSKSGLYFCSTICKGIYQERPIYYNIPKLNPLFSAIDKVYDVNRQPEYIVDLSLRKTNDKYRYLWGDFIITAIARVNGVPNSSKTPKDMDGIKDCFNYIKLDNINDILKKYDISNNNWESIKMKKWNENDITILITK